jgi:hypothetical protein
MEAPRSTVDIKFLLQPISTRASFFYKDLKDVPLSSAEKTAIAEYLLGRRLNDLGTPPTVGEFSKRHNLPRQTISHWVDRVQRGEWMHESAGRPFAIDAIGIENVKQTLLEAQAMKRPLSLKDTTTTIIAEVDNTKKRRNQGPTSKCSRTTVKATMKTANIKIRKPQVITDARFRACSDLRMSYSLYIMLKAYTETLPSQLIWNWDATQFVTKATGGPGKVCIIGESGKNDLVTTVGDDGLAIGLKWMHLASANGEYAPFVLLVAIAELNEDECFRYEVTGLSQCNQSGQFGHLVFCKTRSGNDQFFEWFITKIAIPTIDTCRKVNNTSVSSLLLILNCNNLNIFVVNIGKHR